MRTLIKRFLIHLESERSASRFTLQAYGHDLEKFHEFLVPKIRQGYLPGDVTRDHIRDYMAWLGETGHSGPNNPASRGRKLAAIKSFFKYCHREGLLRDNPADDIRLPKIKAEDIRSLSTGECQRLVMATKTDPSTFRQARDHAILTVFLLTGARLRELVALDLGDVDLRQNTIRLHRKGGEVHVMPLAESAKAALKIYLRERRKRNRHKQRKSTRALFISCRDRRIAPSTLGHLVKAYFRKARIQSDTTGPHTLRHTFATLLLQRGENLRVIQVLMNHKSLATTARYLHTRSEELVSAVNGLRFTDQQPGSSPPRVGGPSGAFP